MRRTSAKMKLAKRARGIRMYGNAPKKARKKTDTLRSLIGLGFAALLTVGSVAVVVKMAKEARVRRLLESAPRETPPKHIAPRKAGTAKNTPRVLIAAGIVMLLTAGVIAGYGLIDDYLAGQRAQTVLAEMRRDIPTPVLVSPQPYPRLDETAGTDESAILVTPSTEQEAPEEPAPLETPEEAAPDEMNPPPMRYDAIGVLTIPKLALELPILSEYSESLLKISVCRYEGQVVNRPERLVVAGHNYKSHFGKLINLTAGDEAYFSNLSGEAYEYAVIEITDISMFDHQALELGEWDITLFTCDSDSSRRILIRLREKKDVN